MKRFFMLYGIAQYIIRFPLPLTTKMLSSKNTKKSALILK